MTEFREKFLAGDLYIDIVNATFSKRGLCYAEGHAYLNFNERGDCVIKFVGKRTDHFNYKIVLGSNETEIVTGSEYEINGSCGLKWTVEAASHAIFSPSTDRENFSCDLIAPTIKIYSKASVTRFPEQARLLADIDFIDEHIWKHPTETLTKSILRQEKSVSIDTLGFRLGEIRCILEKGGPAASRMTIFMPPETSVPTLLRVQFAVLCAVSLRLGRPIRALSNESVISNGTQSSPGTVISLFPRNVMRKKHSGDFPPVRDLSSKADSNFIKTASEFFLEEDSYAVHAYLELFWDSEFGSWQTRKLVTGVCVEQLIGYVMNHWKYKSCFKYLLRKGIKDDLKNVCDVLGVDITDYEVQLWHLLRNNSVHFKKSTAHNHDLITAFLSSVTVMNKIIMGLICWTETIVEYGSSGYPRIEYPYLADPPEIATAVLDKAKSIENDKVRSEKSVRRRRFFPGR